MRTKYAIFSSTDTIRVFLILISEAIDTQFLKLSCEHAKPIECVLQRVSGGPVGRELDYQLFFSSKVAVCLLVYLFSSG